MDTTISIDRGILWGTDYTALATVYNSYNAICVTTLHNRSKGLSTGLGTVTHKVSSHQDNSVKNQTNHHQNTKLSGVQLVLQLNSTSAI